MCRTFKKSNVDPGGFSQFVRIPEPHVEFASFRVPPEFSQSLFEKQTLFTEPLSCCLRFLRRLPLLEGDSVALIGFGSIGYLLFKLLKKKNADVFVLDLDDNRLELAASLGAKPLNPSRDDVKKSIREMTNDQGTDLVLISAGNASLLGKACTWLRDGGTIGLFSELSPSQEGNQEGKIDPKELYKREISIIPSYSPGPEDLKAAFEMIIHQEISLHEIKLAEYSLQDIPQAIDDTLSRKVMKAVIKP